MTLYALPLLYDAVRQQIPDTLTVVAPDTGSVKKARQYANRLDADLAIGDKERTGHDENATALEIIGDVAGKTVLLVDDVVISGGTLAAIAGKLIEKGANEVYALATHGAYSATTIERLNKSPIKSFWSPTPSKPNPCPQGTKSKPSRSLRCSAKRSAASTSARASAYFSSIRRAMQITPFSIRHLTKSAELFVRVFSGAPWNEPWTVDSASQRLEEIIKTPGAQGFVLGQQELLGFVAGYSESGFDGRVFYLKEMCVHPAHQGQGLGTRLLSHLENHLQTAGINHLYLITRKGEEAMTFYQAKGYHPARRALIMTRDLA
jgi:aminoglycoside 6'-N-acetyltransferase I